MFVHCGDFVRCTGSRTVDDDGDVVVIVVVVTHPLTFLRTRRGTEGHRRGVSVCASLRASEGVSNVASALQAGGYNSGGFRRSP